MTFLERDLEKEAGREKELRGKERRVLLIAFLLLNLLFYRPRRRRL